ncbi:MAG: M48 family metallopeptidase [Candidatus Omnitrophica bacterium]|nr:M48 family metallopeptidase [Candidatus Omnitrophota bacterium]
MTLVTVDVGGVGKVILEKSRRARKFNLSFTPSKGIRLAVPDRVSYQEAERTLFNNIGWVHKFSKKIKKIEESHARFSKASEPKRKEDFSVLLAERCKVLAKLHGFQYNRLVIREQKTRWGSCSVRGDISLNVKLGVLPEELIDYVIMHELVHIRVKNHGKDFWLELSKYLSGAKDLHSRLKKYHIRFLEV